MDGLGSPGVPAQRRSRGSQRAGAGHRTRKLLVPGSKMAAAATLAHGLSPPITNGAATLGDSVSDKRTTLYDATSESRKRLVRFGVTRRQRVGDDVLGGDWGHRRDGTR